VEFSGKEQEFKGIIKTAYTTFKASIGQGFGVSERSNFTASRRTISRSCCGWCPALFPSQ
jgi:hypothetical protein